MFENFFVDLAEKKKQDNQQEIEEFCRKLFTRAKKEICQEMSFLDCALRRLPCHFELKSEFLVTDGKQISYHPLCLYHLYKRSIKLVNRAYVHMILHCLFKHLWKQKSDARLWDLSCDIAVEWLMDSSVYSCLAAPQSSFRQETYKSIKKEAIEGIAEDIYEALSNRNLQAEEITKLSAEYKVDEHEGWREPYKNQWDNSQVEKKWQELRENMEREMTFFFGDFDSEAERFLNLLKTEVKTYEGYCFEQFLHKFGQMHKVLGPSEEEMNYGLYLHGLSMYGNSPLIELEEIDENGRNKDFVVVIDTKAACEEEIIEQFIAQVETTLSIGDSYKKTLVHILRWNEKTLSWGREDFRPAFTYVEELIKKGSFKNLLGLFYFTDRAGQFPKQAPSYRTAFVFANRESQGVQVPPWAMKTIFEQ